MTRFSSFALSTLIACTGLTPEKARAADSQTAHAFTRVLSNPVACQYLLSLPVGYDAKGDRPWPMILFLHGSGERGDDVRLVAKHGPPKLLSQGGPDEATARLTREFIVVSPQCPKGMWWDNTTLLALLDEIIATHKVDGARVYLTGLSMGGYGTWELGIAHPDRFAAIAPICGGGNFATLFLADTRKRSELRSLGVWAFHGGQDERVPVAESQRLIDALKKQKVDDARLTIYPDAKHDSWTEAYSNPELYAWMLRHKRETPAQAR